MTRAELMQSALIALSAQNRVGLGGRLLPGFGDLTRWSQSHSGVFTVSYLDGVNTVAARVKSGTWEKLIFPLEGLVPPGSVAVFTFRLSADAYALNNLTKDGGFLTRSIPSSGAITDYLSRTDGFTGAATEDRLFACACVVPSGSLFAAITFWDVKDGTDVVVSIRDVRLRYYLIE